MASKKRDLETVPPSPGHRFESYTSLRAAPRVARAVEAVPSWGHASETDVDSDDPNGDRITRVDLDSITPVFSEAEVRELLARADAMEHAAALVARPRPANTTDADASEALHQLAARGRFALVVIWIAVLLSLLMMAATFFKAAAWIT